jgi:probable HAF family extracellular repeat protein
MTESFVIFAPAATQARATLWQNGTAHDLGTLGGNDAVAMLINDQPQVAGISYTTTIANPVTGIPTIDPFFWEEGKIRDLGTLGGTFGFPNWLNNLGQVVGQSNLAGDETFHPFLSTRGRPMRDLGTLGGESGQAFWINDAGEVVGVADLPGSGTQAHDAFLWRRGVMTDLGTLGTDPCSTALSINSQGQIVGASTNCTHHVRGFLWENGGPMIDLNALVLTGSGLTVRSGDQINDRGEIAGRGVLPNGDVHAILLIPIGDCDDDCEGRTVSQNNLAPIHTYGKEASREHIAARVPGLRGNSVRPPH